MTNTTDASELDSIPFQSWGTDDFIQYDFHLTAVTPDMCESSIRFAEDNPACDEHSYNQFLEIRKKVEENFNYPYNLERISDEVGQGYDIQFGYYREPTETAWALLARYFHLNGWLKFTHDVVGMYRWQTTQRGIVTEAESGDTYRIKVYHKLLEQTDGLANA